MKLCSSHGPDIACNLYLMFKCRSAHSFAVINLTTADSAVTYGQVQVFLSTPNLTFLSTSPIF